MGAVAIRREAVETNHHAVQNLAPRSDAAAGTPEATFAQLFDLARALVPTGFLPDHIKTPGQCVAIILAGREMGIGPMQSLRSLNMVKGKIVVAADLQLGRFKADGGRGQFQTLTDTEAVLVLRHPNGDEHTERFTIEDARRAGLSGDNWRKYPKAMLRSRAITAGLKSIGYEAAAGAYDPEEASAFLPSASVAEPGPSNAGASDAPEAPRERLSIEAAEATVLPGKASAWGGFGGAMLKDCTTRLLTHVEEWVRGKVDDDPSDRLTALLVALRTVLDARESGMTEEPATVVRGDAAED